MIRMIRSKVDKNFSGGFYSLRLDIPANTTTLPVMIPTQSLQDIALCTLSADLTFEVTNSADEYIANNTAIWVDYDGVSEINKAVNAIRITNAGIVTTTIDISVRTLKL